MQIALIGASGFIGSALLKEALARGLLSRSAYIHPGERTGTFRLGDDRLLVGPEGKSEISTQDYAVAMLDELERPAHSRRRFTVGY